GRHTVDGVEEVEVQLGLEVGAPLRAGRTAAAPATTPPAAEEPAEEVAETADVLEVDRLALEATGEAAVPAAEPARADAAGDHLANLVVLLALLGIAEHLVGGRDLLETLLGDRVALVGIGVVLLRELAVGALHLLVARTRRDAEDGVVVLLEPLALRCHPSTPAAPPRPLVARALRAAPSPSPAGAPGP